MTVAEKRQIFAGEARQLRRRRQLMGTLVAAALAILAALVTEVSPVPGWVGTTAAALALAALTMGGRAAMLLGQDDRRRRRDAEAVVDLTGSMLVAIDSGERIRMANPAACAVFGRSEEDLLGEVVQEAVLLPEDRAASHAVFARILDGSLDPREHRSLRRVQRPDGTRRDVVWHLTARRDEHGRVIGVLLSGDDVTEARLRELARERERADIEQLHGLAQEVAASDDARGAVVDRVTALVGATFTGLAEPKADGGGAWTYTVATNEWLITRDIPADEPSGVCAVAASGEPMFIADALTDPRVSEKLVQATAVSSLLFQPIKRDEQVVAVLTAGWTESAAELDERRVQLLDLASLEAAIALQRIETLARLQEAALTDALTGMPNRRAFDAELARVLARAARDGGPVTLAVMDLNEFKALNDRAGHDAGDAQLASCAGAWEATLRGGDMLARLGGDEFAAILPDCDGPAAASLVTRLRRATPHVAGASVGTATWTGGSAFELYQAADRALYRDKEAHRAGRLTDPVRLDAVERAGPFEHGVSAAIDALAAGARSSLGLPGIFVNLLGAQRIRHVSCPAGVDPDALRVSDTYCEFVVTGGRPFVVDDARIHPALARHPGIALDLVAYAGVPLADAEGNVLGAVCAVDDRPRSWSPEELRVLDRLATEVSRELEAAGRRPPALTANGVIDV